jgi:ankyrin repeat protein
MKKQIAFYMLTLISACNLSAASQPTPSPHDQMIIAIRSGSTRTSRKDALTNQAADIIKKLGNQLTKNDLNKGLIYAARFGNQEAAATLIDAGADVNTEADINKVGQNDKLGRTPLMHAAEFGNLDIITTLLSAGAEVNKNTPKGNTALSYAIDFATQRNNQLARDKDRMARREADPTKIDELNEKIKINLNLVQALLDAGGKITPKIKSAKKTQKIVQMIDDHENS